MSVPSVHIAKDRLRNLLIADRLMCTPDMSERMTSDIYYTISKFIELKPEAVLIEITHSDIQIIRGDYQMIKEMIETALDYVS